MPDFIKLGLINEDRRFINQPVLLKNQIPLLAERTAQSTTPGI
jgi:hypothetical protein